MWKKAGMLSGCKPEAFLRRREKYCVGACYRYRQKTGYEKIWYTDKALLLYSRRFLLPVFQPGALIPDFLPEQLKQILVDEQLHAAQGLKADIELLEPHLEKLGFHPLETINYDLMELPGPEHFRPRVLPEGLDIQSPSLKDIDALFPLQAGYEREEVVPMGAPFNPAVCRKNLESLVNDNLLLAVKTGGRFVGKINLNAESFTRLQIGGVYVDPACRGRGIAGFMTTELIRRFASRGKTFSLFVRQTNAAARRVYDSLGFIQFAFYRINYY